MTRDSILRSIRTSFFFPRLLLLVGFAVLQGCAFITIPLTTQTQPLEETVVSGHGKSKIFLIDISGIISTKSEKSFLPFKEDISIVSRVKEQLRKAGSDKHIKGLILRINSPGGTVTASDILYQEIKTFKLYREVPVVACMMDIATSGGYYVAMAADSVIAHPTSVTGSIGVIALKFNVQGLMEKIGVQEESIKSGNMKDIWSPFRPTTEEERQVLQNIIDGLQARFVEVITESRRDLTKDQIVHLADGRVFTAKQAAEFNLIDGIGYFDDVIAETKRMAGVKEARVIMYHRPSGYKDNIYSQLSGTEIRQINLINFDISSLTDYAGVRFLYLWYP